MFLLLLKKSSFFDFLFQRAGGCLNIIDDKCMHYQTTCLCKRSWSTRFRKWV